MSRKNLFPLPAAGAVRRPLLLSTLFFSALLALTAVQALGQTNSARPAARLITSSRQVVPMTGQTRMMASSARAVPAPVSAAVMSLERRAFELINETRRARGQQPLVWDEELCRMARVHSQNMAGQNFFDHIGPDGMDMETRARTRGITGWRALAENIAYNQGFDDPAGFAVERWVHSEKHRANLLNRQFTRSAIGVARAADGRIFFTQVFMGR
ncbi:MAG TPA: CAP domain-containing protein [Pyrinomonadaceae bacterium]|jgi:uncharacterized protein YkwD